MAIYEYIHSYVYAKACLEETGGGEGVQLVSKSAFSDQSFLNGKFTAGEYTERSISFKSKGYYKVQVDSMCMGNPRHCDNALQVSDGDLSNRRVEGLNIASDVHKKDYEKCFDPTKYHSRHTGRGPLEVNWAESANPSMCVCKLVRIEIYRWSWLKKRIEKKLLEEFARRYILFNRRVFCTMDQWIGLSPDQLRGFVEDAEQDLKQNFGRKGVRGTAKLSSGS